MGLGNPGEEYRKTRHNAGRMVVERLQQTAGFPDFTLKKTAKASVSSGMLGDEKTELVLPEVFMNLSGKAAPSFVKSVKAAKKLLVVRDDLDLPLGVVKMTVYGRGAGGHKGAESVMRALKTKDFAQLKVGIAGSTPKGKTKKVQGEEKVIKHVVGKFSPKETLLLEKVLARAAEAAGLFVTDGIEKAMLVANTK